MEIKLLRMQLEHFKGIEALELDFRGQNGALYGDNATGKSTVYDGYIWLLTGKDSLGRSDFEIKPLDKRGAVIDHAARSCAEATLLADGTEITLRREYYEKWSKKRGSTEATFDGNTTDYFVDGVPKSKGGFEEAVGALIPLDLLRLLSDPAAFPALKWQDRRTRLYELTELPTDRELMAQAPEYRDLLEQTEKCSLEDLKAKLKARRKKANGRLNDLPAMIGENRRVLAGLGGLDAGALTASARDLEEDEHRLTGQIAAAEAGDLGALEARVVQAKTEAEAVELQNREYRLEQRKAAPDLEGAKKALERAQEERRYWERYGAGQSQEADYCRAQARDAAKSADAHREEWRTLAGKEFDGATVCPTCGQALPKEQIEQAKASFAAHKKLQLDEIQRRGGQQAEREKQFLRQREEAEREAREAGQKAQQALEAEKAAQEALEAMAEPEIRDMPEYQEVRMAAQAALEAAREALTQAKAGTAARVDALRKQRMAVRAELSGIREQLAKEETRKALEARVAELEGERKHLAEELSEIDRLTDQAEAFTRFKAQSLTQAVNGRFRLAEFKLFDEQVNGGLADCCEILCGGVPYDGGLNNGARINVGLDILDVLQAHHGLRLPVFVDNGEAVTRLLKLNTQIIRLNVSENDKELRLEHEN